MTICPEDKHFPSVFALSHIILGAICAAPKAIKHPIHSFIASSLALSLAREQSKDCLLLRPVHLHYWPPPHSITNPRVARRTLCFFAGTNFFTNSRCSDDLIRVDAAFLQRRTNTNELKGLCDGFSHGRKKKRHRGAGDCYFSVVDARAIWFQRVVLFTHWAAPLTGKSPLV